MTGSGTTEGLGFKSFSTSILAFEVLKNGPLKKSDSSFADGDFVDTADETVDDFEGVLGSSVDETIVGVGALGVLEGVGLRLGKDGDFVICLDGVAIFADCPQKEAALLTDIEVLSSSPTSRSGSGV